MRQRFKVSHSSGFYMLDTSDGMAGAFLMVSRAEAAQPGRHGGPVSVAYVGPSPDGAAMRPAALVTAR